MNVDRAVMQLQNARWGILRVKKGEFLVPDNFSNARIVPISPTICLFSQSENAVISEKEVAELNRLAIESSNEYFFARDLSKCPRELHALPPSNLDLMMEDWATRQYKLLEISKFHGAMIYIAN